MEDYKVKKQCVVVILRNYLAKMRDQLINVYLRITIASSRRFISKKNKAARILSISTLFALKKNVGILNV